MRDEGERTMSRLFSYVLAGISLATGIIAILHSRQFHRSMRTAFALDADDLP